jgi:hypothetical protein
MPTAPGRSMTFSNDPSDLPPSARMQRCHSDPIFYQPYEQLSCHRS